MLASRHQVRLSAGRKSLPCRQACSENHDIKIMLYCELTPAVYIAAGYGCQCCDSRLHFSQQGSAAPSFSSPECLKQQGI